MESQKNVIYGDAMINVLLMMKLALDFMTVQRGAAFVLCLMVSALVLLRSNVIEVRSPAVLRAIAGFTTIILIAWLQSGQFDMALKYVSLLLLAVAIPLCLMQRSPESLLSSATLLIWGNLLFSFFCVVRALASGVYGDRVFAPFEHANLFGSYILSSVPLLFVIEARLGIRWHYRMAFIALAWASTSTGSGVLSLLLLINFAKISSGQILKTLVMVGLVVVIGETGLQIFHPELHTKIFSPFSFVTDFGLETLVTAAHIGYSLYDFGPEYESSLTWRIYAYVVFLTDVMSSSASSILFGRGFNGYADIWNGYMRHNDFILTLVDFGVIGLLVVIYMLRRILIFAINHRELLALVPILIFRLMFENNIYSFYLMSSLVINASFLLIAYRRQS